MKTLTEENLKALTPAKAVELLKDGNRRFVNNLKLNRNLLQQVNETCNDQFPFAFILSCIDSRTSAELIFDQGLGDIFSCRIAGNVLNEDILGSMEFACKLAGSKVIVVLGHSRCGAIKGACDHVELGYLTGLLDKIQPAMQEEVSILENRTSKNPLFVEKVATINVHLTLQEITKQSPVIAELLQNGDIAIVGAMYNVETGIVDFFEENVVEKELLTQNDLARRDV